MSCRANKAIHHVILPFVLLIVWGGSQKEPQSPPPPRPPDAVSPTKDGFPEKPPKSGPGVGEGPKDFGALEGEMIDRANIAYRDAQQKRMVKAAEDILRWSEELASTNSENSKRGRPGSLNLLSEIEKSARRILSISGAEIAADRPEKTPASWTDGLKQLEEAATELVEEVKKTRRQVISVPVISTSDTVIGLSRLLREWTRTVE